MLAAVEFSRGVEDAWSHVATFLPKFLGFLVILLVGWYVAKAIAKIVDRVLDRAGFDRAVERGGIKQVLARSQYDASSLVSKIVFYAIFLIVLQMAFGIFGPNPVSDMIAGVVAYLPKVLAAILIIVVAAAIAAAVKEIVEASLGGLSYGRGLALAASATIMAIGFFAALNQLQIAPAIVNGLFYAALAVIVGSAVISIGGGGISPMRAQWEKALGKLEAEAPQLRRQTEGAKERVVERAEQRRDQVADLRQSEPEPATSHRGNGGRGGMTNQ
jgi:hypothetical protein